MLGHPIEVAVCELLCGRLQLLWGVGVMAKLTLGSPQGAFPKHPPLPRDTLLPAHLSASSCLPLPVHTLGSLLDSPCANLNLIPAPVPVVTGCLATTLVSEPSGAIPRGGFGSAGICTLAWLPGSTVLALAASLARAGASGAVMMTCSM